MGEATICVKEVAADVGKETAADGGKEVAAEDAPLVSMRKLFSFADQTDHILMGIGSLCALGVGVIQPVQIILFGDVMSAFNPTDGGSDTAGMKDAIRTVVYQYIYVSVGVFVLGFGQIACWSITASRQGRCIRSAYVDAIIRQEIGWYDVNKPLELASKVTANTIIIQDGIGRKVGDGFQFFGMGVGGLVIGFIKGWELALGIMLLSPLLAISTFYMMKVIEGAVKGGSDAYGVAGGIAQETLGNVRTILSFNSIQQAVKKYAAALKITEENGIKKGVAAGSGEGFVFFIMLLMYACGMYFGAVLVADDQIGDDKCVGSSCYDGGRVLIVFFSIIIGAMAFGQAGPSVQAVIAARAAAVEVFGVIDRPSKIDALGESGEKLKLVEGNISLENIKFRYPSRPEVVVCENYSLEIAAGETVALVGPSGSGESTIIGLLERYYDPEVGSVKIDGKDIKSLNVRSLRENVALVGQEPALFQTTIANNIAYGKTGATMEEIHNAARSANAYEFIMAMPLGFDTCVGDRGVQLSGGQKQRIAIARAIIKDPPILLLDEATSALDTDSERIVQNSLDKLLALKKRTTIVIAHRLSTIQNADKIAVIDGGKIVEMGSHTALMAKDNGIYKKLVEAQHMHIAPIALSPDNKEASEVGSFRKTTSGALSVVGSLTDDEKPKEQLYQVTASRIWQMSKEEKNYIIIGVISAIFTGAAYPVWGVLLNKVTVLFFKIHLTKDQMRAEALWWSLAFAGLGIVFGAAGVMKSYGFAVTSEQLTTKIRIQGFRAMLEQEVGWYDLDENSSGALTTRLASDTALIQANTSEMLNRTVVSLFTLGVAFAIAFYYSWLMTLVLLAVFPILIFGNYVQMEMMSGQANSKKSNNGDVKAGSLLAELVANIRTVASLSMESRLNKQYYEYLSQSKDVDMKTGIKSGFGNGLSQGLLFAAQAILFYFGGEFVSDGRITFEKMFGVLLAIMLSASGLGSAAQNMTDAGKAKQATSNAFAIIDRQSLIPASGTNGAKPGTVIGDIEVCNLHFSYPTRPNSKVYKDYSLQIKARTTVALVGGSGEGKSTLLGILERFYNPSSGCIKLDGHDISTLNVAWLRDHISLVGQEPVLFGGTIAENIAYGRPGASMTEIEDAAKMANAFDFINQFPDKFNTDVGVRGVQVSGGQKQRIAIARSIIRDPPVLLLDEATSALDNESEKIVQASLDKLLKAKPRTTIVIAHRLSSIKDSDAIAVVKNGHIVELGKHEELMEISGGVYRGLVAKQMNISELQYTLHMYGLFYNPLSGMKMHTSLTKI